MITANELAQKKCVPCEGGIPALNAKQVQERLDALPAWSLGTDGKHIRREWKVRDFAAALEFFQNVGAIADKEDHHPDLHLTGYRNVAIEISTHAVGGLTDNDFVLAAKINQVPLELKK